MNKSPIDLFSEFEKGIPAVKKEIWRKTEESLLADDDSEANLELLLYIFKPSVRFLAGTAEQEKIFEKLNAIVSDRTKDKHRRLIALNILGTHALRFGPSVAVRIYDAIWRVLDSFGEEPELKRLAGYGLIRLSSKWLTIERTYPPEEKEIADYLDRERKLAEILPALRPASGAPQVKEWEMEFFRKDTRERVFCAVLLGLLDWYSVRSGFAARLHEVLESERSWRGEASFGDKLMRRLARLKSGDTKVWELVYLSEEYAPPLRSYKNLDNFTTKEFHNKMEDRIENKKADYRSRK